MLSPYWGYCSQTTPQNVELPNHLPINLDFLAEELDLSTGFLPGRRRLGVTDGGGLGTLKTEGTAFQIRRFFSWAFMNCDSSKWSLHKWQLRYSLATSLLSRSCRLLLCTHSLHLHQAHITWTHTIYIIYIILGPQDHKYGMQH